MRPAGRLKLSRFIQHPPSSSISSAVERCNDDSMPSIDYCCSAVYCEFFNSNSASNLLDCPYDTMQDQVYISDPLGFGSYSFHKVLKKMQKIAKNDLRIAGNILTIVGNALRIPQSLEDYQERSGDCREYSAYCRECSEDCRECSETPKIPPKIIF